MKYVFNVNETTIVRFLVACLRRSDVYVLGVDAWFRPLQRLFLKTVQWAQNSGRARDAMDLCPEHRHLREQFNNITVYNIFERTERWQNDFFDFDDADRRLPPYAMAYKKLVCSYMRPKQLEVLVLTTIASHFGTDEVRFIGLTLSTVGAAEAYGRRSYDGYAKAADPRLFPAINFIFSVGILGFSIAWIARRLRPWAGDAEPVFLLADEHGDPRDHRIYRELADGGPIVLVVRQPDFSRENNAMADIHRWCRPTGGRFTLASGWETSRMTIVDVARLFRHFWRVESGLFYQVAALPYRRAVFRALFGRYRPKFCWSRDEYNAEHVFRRQELHRLGGKTFGIIHGVAAETNLLPGWRYISLDQFYVFGNVFFDLHKDTWAKDMKVKAVGTFSASREDYAFIGAPRPKDIAVLAGLFTLEPGFVAAVRELAGAFPDKKIWLQLKVNYARMERGKRFIESCARDLPNVIYTEDRPFEIFRRVTYVFSDPSTVVIEALQFGLCSFMFDVSEVQEKCVYRQFPDICLKSAAEAIEKIRKMESGEWRYPSENYADLVDLSGRIIFDVIRKDMGLPVAVPSSN